MSLNIIIVAAIALIVLVVLVAIFTGRMGAFGKKLNAEQNKYCGPVPADAAGVGSTIGGTPTPETTGCQGKTQIYGSFGDVPFGYICCK